jgi:hypothetical protein
MKREGAASGVEQPPKVSRSKLAMRPRTRMDEEEKMEDMG